MGGGGGLPESSKNHFAGWTINPRPDSVFNRKVKKAFVEVLVDWKPACSM